MKIEKIEISAIGGIDNLELEFNPGLNLICGPNGVGKTTILECISHSFTNFGSNILKRNVNYESGEWYLQINVDDDRKSATYQRKSFHPSEPHEYATNHLLHEYVKNIIIFKSHRPLNYVNVSAISKDPNKDNNSMAQEIQTGANSDDIKQWFLSRFMWSAHDGLLSVEQKENFELAKKCFGIIDSNVTFKKVIPDTHEILLSAFEKDIYFEYLSSGYKSVLILLLGLIKEIEHRFKNPSIKVSDFSGVLLIDEADIHLHPQWQSKLINILKEIVPNAQIVATTHSPHMIQVANPNELIALGLDAENKVYRRELPNNQYGFQGWTVEEILKDVMGLEETRSQVYIEIIHQFEEALADEDIENAQKAYEVLEEMLHPKNPLRKILELQLSSLGGEAQ